MSDPMTQSPDPASVETSVAPGVDPMPVQIEERPPLHVRISVLPEPDGGRVVMHEAASKPARKPRAPKPADDLRPVMGALTGLVRALRDTLPSQVQDEADAFLRAAREAGL